MAVDVSLKVKFEWFAGVRIVFASIRKCFSRRNNKQKGAVEESADGEIQKYKASGLLQKAYLLRRL